MMTKDEMMEMVREAIRSHPSRANGLSMREVRSRVDFEREEAMMFYDCWEEVKEDGEFEVREDHLYVKEMREGNSE